MQLKHEIDINILEIEQKAAIIAELQDILQEKKAQYKQLKKEIKELEAQCDELEIILKQREDELETLEDVLRDKDVTIAGLEKALGEKAPHLGEAERVPKAKSSIYKAVAGDQVDELLAQYINDMGVGVPIRRLEFGYYLFGTKKIYAKVLNQKLVVRVGGGYMSFTEFIQTNEPTEQQKIADLQAAGNWDLEAYVLQVTSKMGRPEEKSRQSSKYSFVYWLTFQLLDTMNINPSQGHRGGSAGNRMSPGIQYQWCAYEFNWYI